MSRSWKALERERLSKAARARVRARVASELDALSLAELRRKLDRTQAELATAAEMSQPELSRIESRSDHLTSTLRRYIQALGGELEITVVIDGQRIKLIDA